MVQGVGFRYFIYRHASRLGLVGFTRNLPGGDVEIELEGEQRLIAALLVKVSEGPRMAQVTKVDVRWQDFQHKHTRFEIRR